MPYSYAHMCQDGHQQIGHNDSESEVCPLCILLAQRKKMLADIRFQFIIRRDLPDFDEFIKGIENKDIVKGGEAID